MTRIFLFLPLFCLASIGDANAADASLKQTSFDQKDDCDQACIGDHDFNCTPATQSSHQFSCRCLNDFYSRAEICAEECEKENDWSIFIYGECKDVTRGVRGLCRLKCIQRLRLWTIIFVFVLFTAAAIVVIVAVPNFILTCYVCIKMSNRPKMGLHYYPSRDDFSYTGDFGGTNDLNRSSHVNTVAQTASLAPGLRSWNYPYHAYYGGKMRD